MATYINTSSAWFYEKESEVLFINEDTKKVGILTNAPQYELDVKGAIYANTYCNLPAFALSNQIYPVAVFGSNTSVFGSNAAVFGSNVSRDTSNLLNTNFQFSTNKILTSNLLACSNLQVNSSNLLGTNKKIDYNTWISGGPVYQEDNTLAIAGMTLGAVGILGLAGQQLLKQNGMGELLKNDVLDKLGGGNGETEDSVPDADDLTVHYNNITFSPLFTKRGKTEVGFNSNVYISSKAKLCGIFHDDLLVYDSGKTKRIVVGAETRTVYDFSNNTLFCDSVEAVYDIFTSELQTSNIITSNLTATSNVIANHWLRTSNVLASNLYVSSNIITSNLTTSNLSTSNLISTNGIKMGNVTVNSNGYFLNYQVPFDEYQVINRFGQYRGDIYLSQIVDIDAIDLSRLKVGQFKLDEFSFGTDTIASPFSSEWNF